MLLNFLIDFFSGYDTFKVKCEYSGDASRKISESAICFKMMKVENDGRLIFRIMRKDFVSVCGLLENCVFDVERKGLPEIFSRYRRRPGIAVGFLIFLLTLCFSQNFIWKTEVSGNTDISDEEILQKLENLGCGIGDYIPKIDFYGLCSSYIASDSKISWISVNRLGGYVTAEVLETKYRNVLRSESAPSDMVAKCDGRIEYISAYSGIPMVKDGESVHAGQLLISGVWEDKNDGEVRYVRADGDVTAHTLHEISADVPLTYFSREYSDKTFTEKEYSLFGFAFPRIVKKSSIDGEYEIEAQKYPVMLFDKIYLPIFVSETRYYPYIEKSFERSRSEAIEKAESEIAEKAEKELAECEISARSNSGVFEEDENGILHYRLTVSFSCIENIAEEAFISVRD